MTHPRLRSRGTPQHLESGNAVRAIVFAPEPSRGGWIESELADEPVTVQVARNIAHVVAALVEDPPPRPQVLIVDFDATSPAELLHLHAIREQGWFGVVIALGRVPPSLRTSLRIDRVLTPPFVRDTLRDAVTSTNYSLPTSRMPKIVD
jgi:hypothetical protein